MKLTKVKRQTDNLFIEILEEIRFGICTPRTLALFERLKSRELGSKNILPTKLCTHKDDVDLINKKELDALKSEPYHYKAIDMGDVNNKRYMLNTMCPAREELTLKVNAQVMLIKNLDVNNNLVNGSRGIIVGFNESSRLPIVKFMDGTEMTIKYETWSFSLGSTNQAIARRQLPLQLAWALSIHKSQVSRQLKIFIHILLLLLYLNLNFNKNKRG